MTHRHQLTAVATCPRIVGQRCPGNPCLGLDNPRLCEHQASLISWRRMTNVEQSDRLTAPKLVINPAVRDAVNACLDRGSVLPISMQEDCGCRGVEVTECRAGRGVIAGRVTLRDCLNCRSHTS